MQAQGSNSPGHVTTEPTIHDVNVAVDADPKCVQATVSDRRASAVEEFGRLAQTEMEALAEDIWRVGLNAVTSARANAVSDSIERRGGVLIDSLERLFTESRQSTADAINESIGQWFDQNDGTVTKELREAIGPDGDLERMLREAVGPEGIAKETLNSVCGPGSPIFGMKIKASGRITSSSLR